LLIVGGTGKNTGRFAPFVELMGEKDDFFAVTLIDDS